MNAGELQSSYQISKSRGQAQNQETGKHPVGGIAGCLAKDLDTGTMVQSTLERSDCLPKTNRLLSCRAKNQIRSVQFGRWCLISVLLFLDNTVTVLIPMGVYEGV